MQQIRKVKWPVVNKPHAVKYCQQRMWSYSHAYAQQHEGLRWKSGVNFMLWPLYPCGNIPQYHMWAGWIPEAVWTWRQREKYLILPGIEKWKFNSQPVTSLTSIRVHLGNTKISNIVYNLSINVIFEILEQDTEHIYFLILCSNIKTDLWSTLCFAHTVHTHHLKYNKYCSYISILKLVGYSLTYASP
jgi:hypothetical protein